MAPKAKRPAASSPVAAGKRRKSQVDPVVAKCDVVGSALLDAEELPESVREMLANTLKDTLAVMKAARHPYQEQFVLMIGESLNAVGARIVSSISDAETELGQADTRKAELDAAAAASSKLLGEKKEAVGQRTAALAEAAAALKSATAGLKEAQKEERDGNKDLEEASSKKAELDAFKTDILKALIAERAANKQDSKQLGHICKQYKYDADLVKAVTTAFQKGPDDRGEFNKLVGTQFEEQIDKTLAGLNDILQSGEPGKIERAGKVSGAQSSHDAAESAHQACLEALSTAKSEESEADKNLKDACKQADGFGPALAKTKTRCEELKEALTEFNEGALANFKELSVRVPEEPAPPAETAPPVASPSAASAPAASPAKAAATPVADGAPSPAAPAAEAAGVSPGK